MDPNANLARQRALVKEIHAIVDNCRADGSYSPTQLDDLAHSASELADLVAALDEWITNHAFLPTAWAVSR